MKYKISTHDFNAKEKILWETIHFSRNQKISEKGVKRVHPNLGLNDSCSRMIMCNCKKKAAFTLAELLVTIVILGVVAVLTLSVVVRNYKNTITALKVKKAYSTIDKLATNLRFDTGCPDVACAVNIMVRNRKGFQHINAPAWEKYDPNGNSHYFWVEDRGIDDRENFNNIISEYTNFKNGQIIDASGIFTGGNRNSNTYLLDCHNWGSCTDRTPGSPRVFIQTPDKISYNFYLEKADYGEDRQLSQVIMVQVITEDKINRNTKLMNGRNVFYFMIYGNFQVEIPFYSNWGQLTFPGSNHTATVPRDENNDFYCTTDTYYARKGFSCARRVIRDGEIKY